MPTRHTSTPPPTGITIQTHRSGLLLLILLGVIALCAAFAPRGINASLAPSPLSNLPVPTSPLPEVAAMVPPTPIPPQPTPTQVPFATPPPPSPLRTPKVLQPPVEIDLAKGWLREFTFTFFVERTDGRQQIYFVPIVEVPLMQGEVGRLAYERYRQNLLQLKKGDRLIYECASPTMWMVPAEYRCFGRKQVTLNTPP